MKRNARLREQAAENVLQIISRPYLTNIEEAGSGIGKYTRKIEFMKKMEDYKHARWLRQQQNKKQRFDTQLDQQFEY